MPTTTEAPAPRMVVRPPGPSALPRAPTRSKDREPGIVNPGRIQARREGHAKTVPVREEKSTDGR
jgi:hypothetical protein